MSNKRKHWLDEMLGVDTTLMNKHNVSRVTISFDCTNAAFEDPQAEIQRILDQLAASISSMEPRETRTIRDINGNTIGQMTIS